MKKVLFGCEIGCCLALGMIILLIMLQAILRSSFSTGLSWTNEALFMSQIVTVYLIVPVLFAERENVRVDVFFHLLPKKLWNAGWIVTELICLAFSGIFFISITQFLMKTWHNATAIMKVPNGLFYGAIWIGMLLSIICIAINLVQSVQGKKEAV